MEHFNLIAEVIKECFKPITFSNTLTYKDIKDIKNIRNKFADSQLLKMWCDISDNFEYTRLSNAIKEFNK